MSFWFVAAIAIEIREQNNMEKLKRRILRDHSNPLSLSDALFVAQYRLNKDAFSMVLSEVEPYLKNMSIPPIIQLAATLRFFGEGGYQRSVGTDANIQLGRSTVSKVIGNVLTVLEWKLCQKWIKLNVSESERRQCKSFFFNKWGIPGVIGCIDGTHIELIKPLTDAPSYYNRKGYFSINAMIICDHNMTIQAVDATHPGSSHDSFIWKLSNAYSHFVAKYRGGERCFHLLGDSGYGIEPFLITPFRNPIANTIEHNFNVVHASARNIVERTIGVLKSRFRCLISCLHYSPQKVVKIINVCCALHNVCRHYNVNFDEENITENINFQNMNNENNIDDERVSSLYNEGVRVRNEIANNLTV
ncbi:PREDICTED: putative nuclease HARBI1 [Rhagoletis zephyria]|uniref:putative nuclease HARBI1 n=2 Tax=Rhagoletis TaxID=28609 RepID=UPI00081178C1|nr:PREDICTED: putative nuclease HARBI1 [Rhagoletis zephyria]XP_036340138.1 putative nuclease HARBI1 [Rhagoletis pomonella]